VDKLNDELEQAARPAREQGIEVVTKVLFGKAFLEIIREVLREDHDLVMKTARGEGGPKGTIFGSLAMHLLRKCPCPVWVVKKSAGARYRRIVAAVDPNPSDPPRDLLNVKIMDLAISLARREGSELLVVHAWSLYGETLLRGGFGRTDKEEVDRLLKDAEAEHRKRLEDLLGKQDLQGLPWRTHLIKGDAGRVIPALAAEKEADLIVMGTVSRSGVAGLLIGNTAEKTLQRVECSILAVKPDGFVSPVKTD